METTHVLRFAPTADGFADAATRLRAILDARQIHGRHRHDIEIVFDEVATNIVNHGRPSGPVEASIRFEDETTIGAKLQRAELDYLLHSEAGSRTLAENYVGLPLDFGFNSWS